jgi:hypothetical protein
MNQSTPVCTPEQIEILKTQQFSDIQPGTLLKDFNALLDFVGEAGVAVSEKTQLLAMNLLAELNQRLSSPLQVKLKRPLQKSYPHINGLYLLLRCSGLAYLDGNGKKVKLMINKKMLAKWRELNPTEQYFFLLQSYYYRADAEIIVEQYGIRERSSFFDGLDFFQKDLKKGFFDAKNNRYYKNYLHYSPGLFNLALMLLFGFIAVELDTNDETETWPIAKVKLTDFGHSILSYFSQCRSTLFNDIFGNDEEITGSWEDELKKIIPAWQKSLLPDNNKAIAAQTEGCYVFKVKLGKANYKFGVPVNLSLHELAYGILKAFDFEDTYHLYMFSYKNEYGIEKRIDCPSFGFDDFEEDFDETDFETDDEDLTTDKCSVGYLPLYKGMTFTFLFDFGDNWEFKIQVVEMPSLELHFDDLTVIEKKGTPPKQYPNWDEDDE